MGDETQPAPASILLSVVVEGGLRGEKGEAQAEQWREEEALSLVKVKPTCTEKNK